MNGGFLSLHLFKQNLKFSSAHFLIFDEKRAEMLHGHNYQVQLDIYTHPKSKLNDFGYIVDFSDLKKFLKTQVDLWDEHVLLPHKNSEIKLSDLDSQTYKVQFRDRTYAFPKQEVVLLPIFNTSVELLSEYLSSLLFPYLQGFDIQSYHVRVEETPGQGATYIRNLDKYSL